MKKHLLSILLNLLTISAAYADNFNYASKGECETAMEKYEQSAESLSQAATNSHNRLIFLRMGRFFANMTDYDSSGSRISCNNNICTYTTDANCSSLDSTESRTIWPALVAPLLEKEVNFLQTNEADANVPRVLYYTCPYNQKNSQVDWSKCQITIA